MGENYIVNEGKNETVTIDGVDYQRLAIKTHVITDKDNICDVAHHYAAEALKPGDILFITEKAVACTQGPFLCLKYILALWQSFCANLCIKTLTALA